MLLQPRFWLYCRLNLSQNLGLEKDKGKSRVNDIKDIKAMRYSLKLRCSVESTYSNINKYLNIYIFYINK
jgi:hypothetical protein